MPKLSAVKPYLVRIKKWKIRNMVMLYLEAREQFKTYRRSLKSGVELSFEKLREVSAILFEIKEDHHLLYKRVIDSKQEKFEHTHKFTPNKVEIEFMNNIGLLFHKVMVARELKYVMEHYVEESETFQKNRENLKTHITKIDELFDEGIEILKLLIEQNHDNILLLTLLLENQDKTKKHFGETAVRIIEQFGNSNKLGDIYYNVGQYYVDCGRAERAKKMFKWALQKNAGHKNAQDALLNLN